MKFEAMDAHIFSTKIADRVVELRNATDISRFSFILQDSISYLDLQLPKDSWVYDFFPLCALGCGPRRLTNFVNTEEKCREFFAPRRRLLYTMHLDLPQGRECSLKNDVPRNTGVSCSCISGLHIADIKVSPYSNDSLSSFIDEALRIYNHKKLKILKWVVKVTITKEPLLSRLSTHIVEKFMDCFYPEITDSALLADFIQQFDILRWMMVHKNPDVLEFLLYHARVHGNIHLDDDERDIQLINFSFFWKDYENIAPILKYTNHSAPTFTNYLEYSRMIMEERYEWIEEVLHGVDESITTERLCRMMQIICVYIDSQLNIYSPGQYEAAREGLRLIWCSIPDECVTFEELKDVFEGAISEEELMEMFDLYVETIGEFHDCIEPRSLQHLCRIVLRRIFEENGLWIPDGIRRTGLPKKLQAFLNLEKPVASIQLATQNDRSLHVG